MPASNRIQAIIQKHVEACFREVATVLTQELTQPLGDRIGLSITEAVDTQADVTPTEPSGPLHYDARSRKWVCTKCHEFSDPRRRAVTAHMRFCRGPTQIAVKPASRRKPTKKTKK